MAQLIDAFGYLSVLLRGLSLAFQSLVIGGVVFILYVIGPLRVAFGSELKGSRNSCRRAVAWSAIALVIAQLMSVGMNASVLAATTDMTFSDIAGADFVMAGTGLAISAFIVCVLCWTDSILASSILLPLCLLIIGASVSTSHAAARLDDRLGLTFLTGLHQFAAAIWIGGLPYLLLSLRRLESGPIARSLCRRFSGFALTGVVALAAAGILLSIFYIDAIQAIYGTAYGVMVMSKVVMFGLLLPLGALNFFIVRQAQSNQRWLSTRLRRFAEAEIGIGFTVILAAASLTSQPPAVDMSYARVTGGEIVERFTPQLPRLTSPKSDELSEPTLQTRLRAAAGGLPAPPSYLPGSSTAHPNTPADLAWSEYNHHWAGLIVGLMGLLALIARSGRVSWARNWPLLFWALAVFLFLRADPESWPLGLNGFWTSFTDSEVLQHRIFIGLIIAFGLSEWRVQTAKPSVKYSSHVFPLVCAIGGALLLTHSHALGNVKEELLAELSHVPLAILGVMAGWSRWLELRLPQEDRRIPSMIWPACFIMIGAVLLNYRES
jgi:copper resistance protein D